MLDVRSVSKTYGRAADRRDRVVALDGVELHVAQGELVTVLGPSGCGKTTLLRALAGFETPDSGTIVIDDREVFGPGRRTVPAHDRGIGFVPQEGALFPHLSVAQNVGFGLRQLTARDRRARVMETLDLVGLAHVAKRRPHQLSGGQQQRVALARAIAPGPRVILLDEPFASLDEYLRESLRADVRALLSTLGTTAVLVTHDREEALVLGDRVAVMREGRMVQVAEPRATYFEPVDLELARFLGEAVVVDGEVSAGASGPVQVSCIFGTLPAATWDGVGGHCRVLIRPENIRVRPLVEPEARAAQTDRAGLDAPGVLGTIREQTFYGHDGVLHVQVPPLPEHIPVRVLGGHPYHVGDRVRLVVADPVCTYSS